jgi:hypothetical protein
VSSSYGYQLSCSQVFWASPEGAVREKEFFMSTIQEPAKLFFAADESRSAVTAVAVFHGTQTGPGGPVPATGKTVAADYAYCMEFDRGCIKHLTKIWNDSISLQQLGRA